jgi:hypothetical protein
MKKITHQSLLLIICLFFISGLEVSGQTTKKKKRTKSKVMITSMSPSTGNLAGNTLVTLTGTGFDSTKSVGVFFKNTVTSAVIQVAINNYTKSTITFMTPAVNQEESFSVYLELDSAATEIPCPTNFSYKKPSITSISPNSSSVKGGDTIEIKGSYFSSDMATIAVNFNLAGAQKIISATEELITVINPAYPKGKSVNVTVGVQSVFSDTNSASKFTYISDLPDSIYTLSLNNLTGLSDKYKVYVLGYSTASKKMLTVPSSGTLGVFSPMSASPDSGYVESFELGKDITKIQVSNKNPIIGARIYFFVVDKTATYKDSSNHTNNQNLGFKYLDSGATVIQIGNPPQTAYPQYNYIEATFKTNEGLYIDISTVDGFFFPLSLIAQNKAGLELDRIGQPHNVSAQQITSAYLPFMQNLKSGGEKTDGYKPLAYKANKDLTALLNPGLYLDNNPSELETVFDDALNTLFSSTDMKIWQNGAGTFSAFYDVTPDTNQTFPGTTNKHPALKFTSGTYKTLYIFNPVGFSVVSYLNKTTNARMPIMGKIDKNVLTFTNPLPSNTGLQVGMYVSSGGGSTDGTTKIVKINKVNNQIVSVNLNSSSKSTLNFQYKFSKAPTNYYYSSGQMAFAGIGVLADGAFRYPTDVNSQTVVNGFENQISTALNRGVAISQINANGKKGGTTENWAIETNWYPKNQPQNYFSYFMHTAKTSDGKNIFSLPLDSVKSARGDYMSRAYGFAYDENPNPLGGYLGPQVPSEFPGVFPKGTTQLLLELGPWLTPKK